MVLTIVPFTAFLGIDHLVLRSPITALLKVLSIVPLFGFWYFYDIAQATGERELIEKYGIAVPFYGPLGIGAGIFSGSGVKEAPSDSPRPWRYMLYALTTYFSVFFPLNKLVLGDYFGAFAQLLMYVLFPLTFLALIWSFYDIYRVIFDTKGLFDNGASRFFPASWLLDPNFDRSVLGPKPRIADTSILSAVTRLAVDATLGIAQEVVTDTKGVIKTTADTASGVVETAGQASEAVAETVGQGAKAAEGIVTLIEKLPEIGEKVASNLADPNVLAQQASKGVAASPIGVAASQVSAVTSPVTQLTSSPAGQAMSKLAAQAGGALGGPSISTAALLFSVGILAFSGYVFYTMRNTLRNDREKSDEPPRDSGATRVPSEAHG